MPADSHRHSARNCEFQALDVEIALGDGQYPICLVAFRQQDPCDALVISTLGAGPAGAAPLSSINPNSVTL